MRQGAKAMGSHSLTVRSVRARPVDAPLERPIRTAVGTIPSAPLVLIDVLTEEGVTGSAYVFAYTPLAMAPLARLIEELGKELSGKSIVPFDRMREFNRRFRLLGWQGLVGMAVAGLDMAFWDALGKAAGWPVVRLLGGEPRPMMAYDSYGVLDLKSDASVVARSVEAGFRGIKIKLGDGDVEKDVATVAGVRKLIGAKVALMVDYNQSLNPTEACDRIERLAEYDLHWVEEPVAAEDLEGHARVRMESPVRIQTGENWWFPRDMAKSIAAGASDYRDGGHHEDWRRDGMAERDGPGGGGVFAGLEPSVRRSERARASRNADRSLARVSRHRRVSPRREAPCG